MIEKWTSIHNDLYIATIIKPNSSPNIHKSNPRNSHEKYLYIIQISNDHPLIFIKSNDNTLTVQSLPWNGHKSSSEIRVKKIYKYKSTDTSAAQS